MNEQPEGPSVIKVTPDVESFILQRTDKLRESILISETGKPLGRYVPFEVDSFDPWDPSLNLDELERRARESKRSKLKDIWKRLGAK